MSAAEEQMHQLRSEATVFLLREEWRDSIHLYSQLIDLCQARIFNTHQDPNPDPDHLSKLNKSLCIAFSNRAEARSKLQDFTRALQDCDGALRIEPTHFKTLFCKGKILLSLNRYLNALDCFKAALFDPQGNGNLDIVNGYLEKCKKLEFQSRTGSFDLSDWVLNGFKGMPPELAEYVGPVVVKRYLGGQDSAENAQLVMWKNFIDKVKEAVSKCRRTRLLINMLSTGEDEVELEVPDMSIFRPDIELNGCSKDQELDMDKILSILDVNSLVEEAVSAKVLGKNSDFYGVGLWILASFINHSCNPNTRRLHVGDYAMVHASRDVKAGEEITFMYFDTLSPFEKRAEMSMSWGFNCKCSRCKFEGAAVCPKQELREIEIGLEKGVDVGGAVYRLEEGMKRWAVRGKGKGYLRASYWPAYAEVYGSDRSMKWWSRRIPAMEAVVDSVVEVVGSEEGVVITIFFYQLNIILKKRL
ncbi:ATP/GTP-binding family protein, putative isoform 1 [Hibiscus syriacus]|uniref:ATP/GTP-binding family protein, putative isoform 1 n=1 Tax=Hibiscus syriacus TaxID=106335 RepID=A0A6A3CWQ3_HIBSY|nr:ATP/GTP-binding family protein, putative isoform 1 [Hibiscus syriacus]